jgi:glycosyltransferase involved in cell wall biosynthesis
MSEAIRRSYVAIGFAPEHVLTIYDGTPIPTLPRTDPPHRGAFRVGTLGRLVAWKGLDTVIRAAAFVLAECPGTQFEIVGNEDPSEPRFGDQLTAEIDRLGLRASITLSPFRADPSTFLRSLNCLAQVSFPAEPFGMSIIEAMALGCPVVASAGGGPLEIIDDGQSGFLVPPRDPVALARAVITLYKNPNLESAMGLAARRRVLERFEVETQVAAQEAALLNVLD